MWFDSKFGRLNTEENGEYLGKFEAEDRIMIIYTDGTYEIITQELTQRLDQENILLIERFDPEKVITAVYLDNDKLQYNIKRFKIETTTLKNRFLFIKEGTGNRLEAVTTDAEPLLHVKTGKGSQVNNARYKVANFVEVTGWKTVGTKLVDYNKAVEMNWEVKPATNSQPELFD